MQLFWTMLSALLLCAGGVPAHAQESAAPEASTPTDTTPAAAPAPKKKKPAPAQPSHRWLELDYAMSYQGSGDDRLRSESGVRLGASVPIARRLDVLVRFQRDTYNTGFSDPLFGDFEVEQELQAWHAGLSAHLPVNPGTHLFLNATYESLKSEASFIDHNDASNNASFDADADGFGGELGIRTMLSPSAEFAASYKRTELEGEDGPTDTFEDSLDTFAAQLAVRVAATTPVDLVLRFEHAGIDSASEEDTDGDGSVDTRDEDHGRSETYLVGLRYRF